jgi:Peptidase inhibitor family I36
MRSRKARLGLCCSLMLVAVAVVAPQASASFGECPAGWLCLWEHPTYDGRIVRYQDQGFWQNLPNGARPFVTDVTSWANRTNNDAKFSVEFNGGGAPFGHYCMNSNTSNPNLAGSGWDDRAKSIIIFRTNNVC